MSETIQHWFENHATDYHSVLGRLNRTRSVLLNGPIERAAQVLERAYLNAVLSIRTKKDRHERAFTAYCAGKVTLKDAALMTVYGGNKKDWLRQTFASTDWELLAEAVRHHVGRHQYSELLETVTDNLTGVAYRKGAFMLAMSGLYEYGCIDSNVARFAGIESTENDRYKFNNAEAYMNCCRLIFDSIQVSGNWPPFVKQWAIYDFERQEHARHMAFFREIPI